MKSINGSVIKYYRTFSITILKYILMIWVGFFLCSGLDAQEKTLNGKITVFDEIPLENVLIRVKSNNQKFYSDSLGSFTVQCSNNDKLTFSAEGFIKRKIRINKEIKFVLINMKLRAGEEAKKLAVGYGHVTDKNKLYAISGKNESEMDFSHYQNIYEILTSNFPGLQIINGDIIIRNTSSFYGSNAALLLVDGRETTKEEFANISTHEIARISVLKDSSASIYGVKGGNGVVIVETKRGGE